MLVKDETRAAGTGRIRPAALRRKTRLLEKGLVEARIEMTGKRQRTVYSITPAGVTLRGVARRPVRGRERELALRVCQLRETA